MTDMWWHWEEKKREKNRVMVPCSNVRKDTALTEKQTELTKYLLPFGPASFAFPIAFQKHKD
jgi:hypothetical protein